jgi:hypothetical protein
MAYLKGEELTAAVREMFRFTAHKPLHTKLVSCMRWAFVVGYRIAEGRERHVNFRQDAEITEEWGAIVCSMLEQNEKENEWRPLQ